MKGHFVNSRIGYETKGCLCIDDFKAFPVKPRILRSGNFGGTRQFQVAKCEFKKLLGTYLIFVNFGAPPHYLALLKYTKKCVNPQQNSPNLFKRAKLIQNFALSLLKSTLA